MVKDIMFNGPYTMYTWYTVVHMVMMLDGIKWMVARSNLTGYSSVHNRITGTSTTASSASDEPIICCFRQVHMVQAYRIGSMLAVKISELIF